MLDSNTNVSNLHLLQDVLCESISGLNEEQVFDEADEVQRRLRDANVDQKL